MSTYWCFQNKSLRIRKLLSAPCLFSGCCCFPSFSIEVPVHNWHFGLLLWEMHLLAFIAPAFSHSILIYDPLLLPVSCQSWGFLKAQTSEALPVPNYLHLWIYHSFIIPVFLKTVVLYVAGSHGIDATVQPDTVILCSRQCFEFWRPRLRIGRLGLRFCSVIHECEFCCCCCCFVSFMIMKCLFRDC